MSHSTAARNRFQTLSGNGAAPIDEGQTKAAIMSRTCLTLVQHYREGTLSKSDTVKGLARLVIHELERASRAGDNINEVSSVILAYLEILSVFDKERATQQRGREAEGKPDHLAKRSIDLELIPFGRPDSVKLPDDLRLTHELQDNYGRDPASAKAMLLGDPSRPKFPSDLWENVLANTFIDFNQIFSQLVYPVDHQISRPGDWTYTWDTYEKAVLFAFPHRELELQQYKKHIQDLFCALPEEPKHILQYDNRVRTRVAESGNLRLCDLSEFNSDYLFLVVSGKGSEIFDDE